MAQKNVITLYSKEANEFITSHKNTKKLAGIKLALKKFSKKLRKQVMFKETKRKFKKK
ncbi:MAG: 50S ribosomal protein L33 [Candidatus Nomurabacteria bacterium]|nr:50S ribosomal protein L33 [Candidatus Nomurabacteria bacterium]